MISKTMMALSIIAVGLISSLSTADVVIIKDGQPNATIIIGENQKEFAKAAAETLQKQLAKATGAELPIVAEGTNVVGNRIIVGDGKLTKALGLDVAAIKYDGFLLFADGSNTVAIVGPDAIVGKGRQGEKHGTLNSVYRFLERMAGIYWIWPGDDGWLVPATKSIAVPQLSLKDEPRMFMRGLPRLPKYELTGNGVAIFGGGGHSWDQLLPAKDYYKDHPEYFAKDKDGKVLEIEMDPKTGAPKNGNKNSVCCSNPDVKRIITENIRKIFDQGYDMVSLAQMDSWGGQCPACQCEGCRKLDGTEADGHVNARRVMNFHLSIARDLYKTHPDKKVWISAYAPCGACYTWLKKDDIPLNVVIEVTGGGKEHIEKWAKAAPAITHYYYGWGIYERLERTPRTTSAEIANYIKHLAKNNGLGIYWCGGCFNWGLAGDQYFLAARLMWNPDEDPAKILDTYYSYFDESRAPIQRFYETLRQTIGAFSKQNYSKNIQVQAYVACFPLAALDEMELWLKKAEQSAVKELTKRKIQVVRDCFDYTAFTARSCHLHEAYVKDLSLDGFMAMKQMVDLREQRIQEIFKRYGYDPKQHSQGLPFTVNGLPVPFADRGDIPEKVVYGGRGQDGHGGMGKLGYPFTGGLNQELKILMRGQGAISGVAQQTKQSPAIDGLDTDDAWQGLPYQDFFNSNGEKAEPAGQVKFRADKKNLYVFCRFAEPRLKDYKPQPDTPRDGAVREDECLEIFLAPDADGQRFVHLILGLSGGIYDSRKGFIKDDLDPLKHQADQRFNAKFKQAIHKDETAGYWQVELKLPYSGLELEAPQRGALWRANFCRTRHLGGTNELSAWNPAVGPFDQPESFGKLYFFEKPARPARNLLANGDFEQISGDGQSFAGWQTNQAMAGTVTIADESKSGKHSLRIKLDRETSLCEFVKSEPFAIGGGRPFSITANIKVPGAVFRTVFGINIIFMPENGKRLKGDAKKSLSLGRITKIDWTEISGSYITPGNTAEAQVSIWGVGTSGEILVDDIRVLGSGDDDTPGSRSEADKLSLK